MRFFFILFFIPTLSFGQSIKLACQETSLIDYSKVQIIEFKNEDINEFEYSFDQNLFLLKERFQDLQYEYMGEDDVSYHFRIETDFSFNTLILYKKILRYERNIFYPDSVNLKKTYYGDCNKSDSFFAALK
ncbi:MAG: hypothetical protein CM15mP30_2430 [Pelagibacteraceae bacterium]|nr:MAG: hypothetical protein CM15mP30_2430 [Pelagibacteraceae bacterium]